MKKNIIIANWKLNPSTVSEAKKLYQSILKGAKKAKSVEVLICPPFVYLPLFSKNVGAQNVFWEEKGAYTGEVSPKMLKSLNIKYVIVGHSERRAYFKETDDIVNKKLKAAISANLIPILCIGESLSQRKRGKTRQVLQSQLKNAFSGIKASEVIVAYEPIWAIGTGKACSPADAKRAGIVIRKTLSAIFNKKIAGNTRILYGGSANSSNTRAYLFEAQFQGLLVGGASLKAGEFVKMIKYARG